MAWDDTPPDPSEFESASWDSTPPDAEDLSALAKNIVPDAEANAKSLATPWPEKMMNLAELGGTKLASGESPLAIAGDATKSVVEPLGDLGSKEKWIEHPVSNAVMVGSLLTGGAEGAASPERNLATETGEAMEKKGANMAADLGNMSGSTVQKMKPNMMLDPESIRTVDGQANPADLRTESGKRLVKEGVVGGFGENAGDVWQKAGQKEVEFGKAVDKALDDIKKTNRATGEYDNVDDALHVQANPILKSVLDTANGLRDSARSGIRQTSRFWRETYNSLASKAEANGGRLNLDDIRSEMQEVGKDMKGPQDSPRYSTAKDIYGHLADVRDQMVNDIAERSGNPQLADNLLKANKGYSFYSRLSRGLDVQAAAGSNAREIGNYPMRATARGRPMEAVEYMGVMPMLSALKPMLAQKLVQYGPLVAKYGTALENAAKGGMRNLLLTDMLIRQKDPEYAKATQ